jgi:hypothetical protein
MPRLAFGTALAVPLGQAAASQSFDENPDLA